MKNNDTDKKGGLKRIFLTAGIVLILAALVMFAELEVGFYNIYHNVATILGIEQVQPEDDFAGEITDPEIKLYSEQSVAVKPEEITPANLKSADGTYNSEGGANTLYDGDVSTCSGSANTWATLDAGELKTLTYIRYIPNTSSQFMANTCVGTRFLASKDNEYFVELGTVYPDVNGDLNMDWHLIEFSGYGEYRYFKVELSPYASFGEIEWVCDEGIKADENDVTEFNFTAFDAVRNFTGYTTLAVYNRHNMLKTVMTVESDFKIGEYAGVDFSEVKMELGDYVRITTYDKGTMTSAVSAPLNYRFTEASSKLAMANIYSDNAMFQADKDLIISGKASCGSTVEAKIENLDTGEIYGGSDIAKDISDWEINFGSFENGGNYKLTVTSEDEKLEFENITFGDIWILAGQSNMDFYLCGEDEGAELLKTSAGKKLATNSQIRLINLYNIGIMGATGEIENLPLNDWNDYWAELTPDRASYLSAIGFYFATGLNERYDRNVGIVSVAVGDTEINQWYPRGESNGSFTGDSGKLYNNRIYPFTKMNIKGILWYQGEADQYRTNMNAVEYSDAMAGLINSYRDKWNDPDLPFYYVQLARYSVKDESEIREGQRIALQKVRSNKNLGMFSLLDIIGTYEEGTGSARTDIHPWQKKTVAERFLNIVGNNIYGDGEAQTTGPVYQSKEIVDDTVVLTFKHTGSLRIMDKKQYADSVCERHISETMTDTDVLHEFWISDENDKFYPANAEIVDDKVVVWSENVVSPKDVMYAWGAYPEMPNLTDDSGLPAFTFNTINGSEFE